MKIQTKVVLMTVAPRAAVRTVPLGPQCKVEIHDGKYH